MNGRQRVLEVLAGLGPKGSLISKTIAIRIGLKKDTVDDNLRRLLLSGEVTRRRMGRGGPYCWALAFHPGRAVHQNNLQPLRAQDWEDVCIAMNLKPNESIWEATKRILMSKVGPHELALALNELRQEWFGEREWAIVARAAEMARRMKAEEVARGGQDNAEKCG